jgi:hypothetical protein
VLGQPLAHRRRQRRRAGVPVTGDGLRGLAAGQAGPQGGDRGGRLAEPVDGTGQQRAGPARPEPEHSRQLPVTEPVPEGQVQHVAVLGRQAGHRGGHDLELLLPDGLGLQVRQRQHGRVRAQQAGLVSAGGRVVRGATQTIISASRVAAVERTRGASGATAWPTVRAAQPGQRIEPAAQPVRVGQFADPLLRSDQRVQGRIGRCDPARQYPVAVVQQWSGPLVEHVSQVRLAHGCGHWRTRPGGLATGIDRHGASHLTTVHLPRARHSYSLYMVESFPVTLWS